MVSLWVINMKQNNFYCYLYWIRIFKHHSWIRKLFYHNRLYLFYFIQKLHIYWVVRNFFSNVKKTIFIFQKASKWMVKWRIFKVSAFQNVYMFQRSIIILLCSIFYFSHMLLFLQELFYKLFIVKNGSMI